MNPSTDRQSPENYQLHITIFLIAFACRLFSLVWIDEPGIFGKYPYFAKKLLEGADIGDRLVDLSPFYLYWTTAFGAVFGNNWIALKSVQAFIGAVNALLVYALGTRVFDRAVGFLAALLYAVYGNLIILESTLEPTVFVLLFNLIAVFLLARAGSDPENRPAGQGSILWAGIFTGLSIVTKPSFLLFVPMGALYILTLGRPGLPVRRKLLGAALFCAAAGLVVMPVTIRNYVKLKDVVLVTADAGKVFFHGNAAGATALEWTGLPNEGFLEESAGEPDAAHVLFRRTASRLSGRTLSPSESSRFWMQRTMADIRQDPAAYVHRELKKLVFFFTDYEMHFIASAYKEYRSSLHFPFLRYGIIASLGIAGMFLTLGSFRKLWLIHAVVLLYLVSGMLFIVQSRYRTPAVPYLCLFAGTTVVWLKQRLAERRMASAAMVVLGIIVLFFFSHFSFRSEIQRADRWQQATKIHYQMGGRPLFRAGRYAAAVGELDRCLAMVPGFSPAYNMRGKARAVMGDNAAALKDFAMVISLSPDMAEGYRNSGFLYLLQGNREMAERYLAKAQALSPNDPKTNRALNTLRSK